MRTRNAVMEGRFYPSSKSKIFEQIKDIESKNRYPLADLSPVKIFGAVLPHAGHLYSGYQTVPFFQLIRKLEDYPDTFIILHPNHSGLGKALAIDDADLWSNAIGEVPLDQEFAKALKLPYDRLAHAHEHSAEVIVPFLQYFLSDLHFSIVPVCMLDQSYESASRVAKRIIQAVNETNRKIMIIASCDFSHFLTPKEGRARDQLVLSKILTRDTAGIEQVINDHRITVCGYGPIMSLMEYAGELHPDYKVQLLARGDSGQVIPSMEVVDYISLIIYQ